jgi:RHS repeat-associated protein
MIEKSGTAGTTIFMQDEAGHLIGEYDGSGNLIEETVWLGDLPVATLRPNGSGGVSIFYVHTDHLNTPRKIAQPSSGTLAWRWDADPFGTAAPNDNPGGLGTFAYNLRFPGQYYMAETGLNQNQNRDYDPMAGKYVESDLIGLRGGINTYAYVRSNPVGRRDPSGLLDNPAEVAPLMQQYVYSLSHCVNRCQGSDVWEVHFPLSGSGCASYDMPCQLAMQRVFPPHTNYYSKSCMFAMGAVLKPVGMASGTLAEGTWLEPIVGWEAGVVALPFTLMDIENSCLCSTKN